MLDYYNRHYCIDTVHTVHIYSMFTQALLGETITFVYKNKLLVTRKLLLMYMHACLCEICY